MGKTNVDVICDNNAKSNKIACNGNGAPSYLGWDQLTNPERSDGSIEAISNATNERQRGKGGYWWMTTDLPYDASNYHVRNAERRCL